MTFMTKILRKYPELNIVQADMIAEDVRVICATESMMAGPLGLELADDDLIELAMSRRLDLLG